jgi:hypothetical protein
MKRSMSLTTGIACVAGALALAAGCASLEEQGPELMQVEPQMMRYEGPFLDILLGTGAAQNAVGDKQWVVLEMALSGGRRRDVKVQRENITLRTPEGERVALASPGEVGDAWGELNAFVQRYGVSRAPMEYRIGDREPCNLPFYATPPGSATISDTVFVNDRDFCRGLIYFRLDGFVQPGRYALVVETDETQVGIPFELESAVR